ncbi:MAG: alkaline phosphatase D family protein [Planctomycetota bacterium]|nr:alkaline phosphatase D family protein [Planctomycetota bacterium]
MLTTRTPLLLVLTLAACSTPAVNDFGFGDQVLVRNELPGRIAFGSCADQERPQPILEQVVQRDPDLFIYLGDNIYGDTEDMEVLAAKYRMLAARPEFMALRSHCPSLAIWDDHDYGANDAGSEYPARATSRELFLDFWREPAASPRREHEGIYHAERFEADGRSLQVILLDTRSFRDPLVRTGESPLPPFKNEYKPTPDRGTALLGEAQWEWLETTLREPADLRVIATSIQFGHSYNGWESWTLIPGERRRMISLIRSTAAEGVVFISGDVHWGEINRQRAAGMYPLYDVTASGINQDWDVIEPSARRVGPAVSEHNVGWIEVDWAQADPSVKLMSMDASGSIRNQVDLRLSDLKLPPAPAGR